MSSECIEHKKERERRQVGAAERFHSILPLWRISEDMLHLGLSNSQTSRKNYLISCLPRASTPVFPIIQYACPPSFQEHSCLGLHVDRPHLVSAYSSLPALHMVNYKLLENFPPLDVYYTPLSFPPPGGPSQHPLQDICLISLNWLSCSQLLSDGIPWSKFPFTHIL